MNTSPSSPELVFTPVKAQPHPDHYVHDMGLEMQWHYLSARLYRRIREHAPYAFTFDDVFIHEEDAPESFVFQGNQIYRTQAGSFYALSPYMVAIYDQGQANLPIFDVLADLDRQMPPDRQVTESDVAHFCKHQDTSEPARPQPRICPTGMLTPLLEERGYRLTNCIRVEQDGYSMLDIGWTPSCRMFFTGVLEVRPTEGRVTGHWRLPGPPGVNRLLRREFDMLCPDPTQCLTPEGIAFCNVPCGAGKTV